MCAGSVIAGACIHSTIGKDSPKEGRERVASSFDNHRPAQATDIAAAGPGFGGLVGRRDSPRAGIFEPASLRGVSRPAGTRTVG